MRAASRFPVGLAHGDAFGRPTEFQDYGSIVATYAVKARQSWPATRPSSPTTPRRPWPPPRRSWSRLRGLGHGLPSSQATRTGPKGCGPNMRVILGGPAGAGGSARIAEEALATALHCYLISPDDPLTVLGRAAAISGDSDSIAGPAGAFTGSSLGFDAWPPGWQTRIEYTDRLSRIGLG